MYPLGRKMYPLVCSPYRYLFRIEHNAARDRSDVDGCDLTKFGLLAKVNRACGLGARGSRLIPERRRIGGGGSLLD